MRAPTGSEGEQRYRPPLLSTVAVSVSRLTRIRHSCHEARPPRERWPFPTRHMACQSWAWLCVPHISLPAGGARSPAPSAAAHRSRAKNKAQTAVVHGAARGPAGVATSCMCAGRHKVWWSNMRVTPPFLKHGTYISLPTPKP